MCTRQSRDAIWDLINTLFLALWLLNLLLLLSFNISKQKPMASRAILSNFFEEQWTQNQPQYLSGLSRALFPTTFLEIAVKVFRKSLAEVEYLGNHWILLFWTISSCFVSCMQLRVKKCFSHSMYTRHIIRVIKRYVTTRLVTLRMQFTILSRSNLGSFSRQKNLTYRHSYKKYNQWLWSASMDVWTWLQAPSDLNKQRNKQKYAKLRTKR